MEDICPKVVRVQMGGSYVVLNTKEGIREGRAALYEDIMNAAKYEELQDYIEVVIDPGAKEEDIPDFLRPEMEG